MSWKPASLHIARISRDDCAMLSLRETIFNVRFMAKHDGFSSLAGCVSDTDAYHHLQLDFHSAESILNYYTWRLIHEWQCQCLKDGFGHTSALLYCFWICRSHFRWFNEQLSSIARFSSFSFDCLPSRSLLSTVLCLTLSRVYWNLCFDSE